MSDKCVNSVVLSLAYYHIIKLSILKSVEVKNFFASCLWSFEN